jgi:hypothetical protein
VPNDGPCSALRIVAGRLAALRYVAIVGVFDIVATVDDFAGFQRPHRYLTATPVPTSPLPASWRDAQPSFDDIDPFDDDLEPAGDDDDA